MRSVRDDLSGAKQLSVGPAVARPSSLQCGEQANTMTIKLVALGRASVPRRPESNPFHEWLPWVVRRCRDVQKAIPSMRFKHGPWNGTDVCMASICPAVAPTARCLVHPSSRNATTQPSRADTQGPPLQRAAVRVSPLRGWLLSQGPGGRSL